MESYKGLHASLFYLLLIYVRIHAEKIYITFPTNYFNGLFIEIIVISCIIRERDSERESERARERKRERVSERERERERRERKRKEEE